jgi:hypothetical protein
MSVTFKQVTVTIEKRLNFKTNGPKFLVQQIVNSREFLPGDEIDTDTIDSLIRRDGIKVVITH